MSVTENRTKEIIADLGDIYAPGVDLDISYNSRIDNASDGELFIPEDVSDYYGYTMPQSDEYDATVAIYSYLAVGHDIGNYTNVDEFVSNHQKTPNLARMVHTAVEDAYVDETRFSTFQGLEGKHDILVKAAVNGNKYAFPRVDKIPESRAVTEAFRQLAFIGTVNHLADAPKSIRTTITWAQNKLDEASEESDSAKRTEIASEIVSRLQETAEDPRIADSHAESNTSPFRTGQTYTKPATTRATGALERTKEKVVDGGKTLTTTVVKGLLFPAALLLFVFVSLIYSAAEALGRNEQLSSWMENNAELVVNFLKYVLGKNFGDQQNQHGKNALGKTANTQPNRQQGTGTPQPQPQNEEESRAVEKADSEDDEEPGISPDVKSISSTSGDLVAASTTSTRSRPTRGSRRSVTRLQSRSFQTDSEINERKEKRRRQIHTKDDDMKDGEEIMMAVRKRGLDKEVKDVFEQFKPVKNTEYRNASGYRLNMNEVARTNAGQASYSDQLFYDRTKTSQGQKSIGVCLDISKSMDLFEAKVALASLAKATNITGDKFTATAFGTNEDYEPLFPLITSPDEEFEPKQLDNVTHHGFTPTAGGVRDIRQVLGRDDNSEQVAIVITDGEPNVPLNKNDKDFQQGKEDAVEEIKKAKASGLTVIGIGVGEDIDEHKIEKLFGENGYVMADEENLAQKLIRVYENELNNNGV